VKIDGSGEFDQLGCIRVCEHGTLLHGDCTAEASEG
jgi:hypothetical protein